MVRTVSPSGQGRWGDHRRDGPHCRAPAGGRAGDRSSRRVGTPRQTAGGGPGPCDAPPPRRLRAALVGPARGHRVRARAPGHPAARSEVLSLDGRWAFALRDRPEDVTDDDLAGPTDGWATVEVPGCWTMQGFDRPQYTNVADALPRAPAAGARRQPDRGAPPHRHRPRGLEGPADHARGGRGRDRPLRPRRRRARRHGQGLAPAPRWSTSPTLVEPGRPFELALTVVRWSDATYLEDQDHWHHAGLHRSVLLHATPPVRIADVHPTADRDPATGDGHLTTRVVVEADGARPRGWTGADRGRRARGRGPRSTSSTPPTSWPTGCCSRGGAPPSSSTCPAWRRGRPRRPHLHDLTVTLRRRRRRDGRRGRRGDRVPSGRGGRAPSCW